MSKGIHALGLYAPVLDESVNGLLRDAGIDGFEGVQDDGDEARMRGCRAALQLDSEPT
jgi:hypothetical protein